MSDFEGENDEDRFDMFDLSMSIIFLLTYIKKKASLSRHFKDIDVLSGRVREQCKNEKYRVEEIKQLSRKLENENSLLKKQVNQMYRENSRLRSERDICKIELQEGGYNKKSSNSNKQLKKAEEQLSRLRQEFEYKIRGDAKRIKEFEKESNEIIFSHEKTIKTLEKEVSRRGQMISELTEKLNKKGSDEIKHAIPRHEHMEDISKLKGVLQHTLTKLHDTEDELEETKTRLSKLMGTRLTDNNPNIADLSDTNRPTKLAERFTELYDNQWSDAFEFINRYFHSETNTIQTLLYILQDTMEFCKTIEKDQLQELLCTFEMSNKQRRKRYTTDVPKQLKECRKLFSPITNKNVYEMYIVHVRRSGDQVLSMALEIDWFTKECIELCWLMVIQDPPIVFADDAKRGSKFDTNLFKSYTSSGTNVDYIVWPALLLYKDGPVLVKGVAQGYGRKSDNREKKIQQITTEDDDYALLLRKDKTKTKHNSMNGRKAGNRKGSQKESQKYTDNSKNKSDQSHLNTTKGYYDSVRNAGIVPIGFDLVNTNY